MNAVIRVRPWQELALLTDLPDRLFERVPARRKTEEKGWTPALEMETTNKAVILRLEVPGIEAKNLDVQVTRDAAFVKGDKAAPRCDKATHRYRDRPVQTPATKGIFHSEIDYGRFSRRIPLPVPVANNQVEARLNNGILTLTLPKLSAVRPEVVKVSIGKPDNQQKISQAESSSEVPPVQVTEPTDLEADPWAA